MFTEQQMKEMITTPDRQLLFDILHELRTLNAHFGTSSNVNNSDEQNYSDANTAPQNGEQKPRGRRKTA